MSLSDDGWIQDAEVCYIDDLDQPTRFTNDVAFYPGGEPIFKARPSRVKRLLLRPKSLASFVIAMFMVDALYERGEAVPELVIPYLPGARQDRLNDEGDFLFTAKSIAAMINERMFPRVIVVDPHSDVMPALIERCEIVTAADVLKTCIDLVHYEAVIAPDGGAEKRAGLAAKRFGLPLVHAWKSRDVATGNISGFGIENINHDSYLIIDDICDGGGTFTGLRQAMAEASDWKKLEVDLYVTHGIFSRGTDLFAGMFGDVYCTDSIPGDKGSARVIQICQRLLEKGTL